MDDHTMDINCDMCPDNLIKSILECSDPVAAHYLFRDLWEAMTPEQAFTSAFKDEAWADVMAKAVWTTEYINDLPDSAFLYIEPDCGEKDETGRTKPRTCRHFPYKDAEGNVDPAHVRNAIARIPQSNARGLSPEKKRQLQEHARRILEDAQEKGAIKDNIVRRLKDVLTSLRTSLFGQKDTESKGQKNQTQQPPFAIFKDSNGKLMWIARYSNNFRDEDRPPEIISARSHEDFVQRVRQGQAPYPDLLIAHSPALKIGKAHWLGLERHEDGVVFALAAGTFLPGLERVAEKLAKNADKLAMSHGMPASSLKYDDRDRSVIVQHNTAEISVLPRQAAANKLTSFVIIGNQKEEKAMIQYLEDLIQTMGLTQEDIEAIQKAGESLAQAGLKMGLEHKEKGDEADAPSKEQAELEDGDAQSATQLKSAVEGIIKAIADLEARIASLESATKEIEGRLEIAQTPMASLAALMGKSAIGRGETKVDEDDPLKDSKPKEKGAGPTPIGLINMFMQKS